MLLILREEIICLTILIFLIFYYSMNKVQDKETPFLRLVYFALAHVAFDIITVITVNHLDTVPDPVNRLMHICFYISGILFVMGFYQYILRFSVLDKYSTILTRIGYMPLILLILLLLFLPMEYVVGNGTNYSYGPLAFIGYGIFIVYCTTCMAILLTSHNKLTQKVKWALIPMIIMMFAAVILQAIIPELLMTGAGVTFVCIGMFVALDNPDKDFKEQALWDFLTGLKNRNCYNRDLAKYTGQKSRRNTHPHIGFLVADMNYLKTVNDNYGHAEGDKLIAAAAEVLRSHLKSAKNVYRLGGDEFVAIYLSPNDNVVSAEIDKVRTTCLNTSGYVVPLRIAMGYASGANDENYHDIFEKADQRMYEHKIRMKQEESV